MESLSSEEKIGLFVLAPLALLVSIAVAFAVVHELKYRQRRQRAGQVAPASGGGASSKVGGGSGGKASGSASSSSRVKHVKLREDEGDEAAKGTSEGTKRRPKAGKRAAEQELVGRRVGHADVDEEHDDDDDDATPRRAGKPKSSSSKGAGSKSKASKPSSKAKAARGEVKAEVKAPLTNTPDGDFD